jgi:O-antigen ligase
MGRSSFLTTSRVVPRGPSSRTWLSLATVAAAFIGGAAATRVSTAYIAGFLVVAIVAVVFLWRLWDPTVPFLLLVAAMQGGVLLRVPLGDAPITTLMPLLGGWTLVAVLADRRRTQMEGSGLQAGKLLTPSLVALAVLAATTALAQAWRSGGRLFSLIEVLTLLQLGVLVWVTAYLLFSPRRVIWMAYVTVAAGAAVAVVGLADQAGLVSLGTEMVYADGYVRVSGLLADPNFFSFQLLIGLAFAVHTALAAKTIRSRVLLWGAFALIFAGIMSSYSAGALVGVGAILAVVILLQFRVSAKRAMAAFCLIAIVTVVVAATAPPGYGEAVKAKYLGIGTSSFERLGTNRGAHWEAALREIADNPVVGVGLSTENQETAIADRYTLSRLERSAAHNMYLSVAVGAGVFGLAAILAILASCMAILWSAYSKAVGDEHSQTALATACLLTALVVVVTQGLQLDLQLEKYVWLLVGASLAVRRWPMGQANART